MIVRLRNIISLLMVVVLLAPSLIKLEHHHAHFVCNEENEKHIHTYHEKCLVCSFEFSVFSLTKTELLSCKAKLIDGYNKPAYNSYYCDCSNYSFLLRAPPLFANSIDQLDLLKFV
jgi:hypothetical protein